MRSWLRVDAVAGRVPRWRSQGAFTVRMTGQDQLHLVGVAAGPLGGDEVSVEIQVGQGASLTLLGTAASVALPGAATDRSSWSWDLAVAEGGQLLLDPQPLIVAGHASHHGATALQLAEGAVAVLREQAQIGRFGEQQGTWRGSLSVDLGGQELLRHSTGLGYGSATWDPFLAPAAVESEFRYPDDRAAHVSLDTWEARLPLAGGGSLTTRLVPVLVDTPSRPFEASERHPWSSCRAQRGSGPGNHFGTWMSDGIVNEGNGPEGT